MKKMIAIRADANEDIAMGHIMRCLSIAVQLKNMGTSILFILSDAYARQLVERALVCTFAEAEYLRRG